jgi:hypothetical protein
MDQGKRVIYDAETEILEKMATSAHAEMATKIRIVSRNFSALMSMKHLMNPFRDPLVSIQLLSHRLLRWFVLPAAALQLLGNALLLGNRFYALLFTGQILFYAIAALGYLLDRAGRRSRPTYLPYYFVVVNLSAFLGILRSLAGSPRPGVWEPVER